MATISRYLGWLKDHLGTAAAESDGAIHRKCFAADKEGRTILGELCQDGNIRHFRSNPNESHPHRGRASAVEVAAHVADRKTDVLVGSVKWRHICS
jgi:hypothetical protein